jgi:hypothetical protein
MKPHHAKWQKKKNKCHSLQEVYQLSPRGKRTGNQLRPTAETKNVLSQQ